MELEYIKVSELHESPRNPRHITTAKMEALKDSLLKLPDGLKYRPILATKEGEILAGNMRFRAAKELGWGTVPVVYVEGLSAQERDRLVLLDNVAYGMWDLDKLTDFDALLLQDLELDMSVAEGLTEDFQDEGDLPLSSGGDQEDERKGIRISFAQKDYDTAKNAIGQIGEMGLDVGEIVAAALYEYTK